jgi:large subunit ribosomal protein L15
MKLHELAPAPGAVKPGFRVGRGIGSGNGKTSGKGHKGAKARSGYSRKFAFEGGQMPLARRLPKRGFTNIFAKPLTAVNLDAFAAFEDGARVGLDELMEKGIVKQCRFGLKILAGGEIAKKLTIVADSFSAAAKQKIEAAGGKAEVL